MKEFSRKVAIITIAILLLLMNVPPKMMWNDDVENDVQAATPNKPTGSSGSYRVDVEASKIDANPSVYWTQIDDLSFTAVSDGGTTPAKNSGNNEPVATQVKNTLDLTKYNMPTSFKDTSSNKSYSKSDLTRVYLKNDSVKFKNAKSFRGINLTKTSDTKFTFLTETGSPNTPTKKEKYGTNPKGQPKYTVRYDTPIDVIWYGEIINQAEMRVVEDSTITIGATKQYKAQVRTKKGTAAWSTWKDVSAYEWKSDKSSVASVSSNGSVKGIGKGQAKITATWKDKDFHLQASANVKVTAEDALTITGTLNACFKDGSTTLKAILYKTGGTSSDVTNTATWTSSDTSVATVSKGVVTFKKDGSTTITATADGKKESVKVTVIDCTITTPPEPTNPEEPTPPPPTNEPPIVKIEGDSKVIVGETVCYKAIAEDPDGFIETYEWSDYNGSFVTNKTKENMICGKFEKIGEEKLGVIVTDNGNEFGEDKKDGYDDKIITVVAPQPKAYVDINGVLKENRKITAQATDAYGGNKQAHQEAPIIKQTLTIKSVDESNKNKLFIVQDISGNVDETKVIEFLGKFEGDVEITRYVENSKGQSDTFTTTITLQPDKAPIVDFDVPTLVYRVPTDKGTSVATINISSRSYSEDDAIQKQIYRLKYDSDNDGDFDDEDWQLLSDNNEETIAYKTEKVGKYLIELEVWERFAQETIPQFVDQTFNKGTTDLQFGDTTAKVVEQKVVEVDNLAPVVSLDAKEKKTIELQFDTANSPYPLAALESNLPYLKNLLIKENININLGEARIVGGIEQVVGGFHNSFFLTEDKRVYAIGSNYQGQLGIGKSGENATTLTQVNINSTSVVKQISGTTHHTIFLMENGDVFATGDNTQGVFGNGTVTSSNVPVKVNLPFKVKQVLSSYDKTYFLSEEGNAYATGNNANSEFGIGDYPTSSSTPLKVNLPSKVKQISSGYSFAYFLLENGDVYGAGLNKEGSLGIGTTNTSRISIPVRINLPSKVKQISSGYSHSQFLLENGDVYGTGDNLKGALGNGTYINRNIPVRVDSLKNVKQISSGGNYTHFLLENGNVYATGDASNGALGVDMSLINSRTKSTEIPLKVDLPSKVKQISDGRFHTNFLTEDGYVYANGYNSNGQIVGSTSVNVMSPIKLSIISPLTIYNKADLPLFAVGLNQQGTVAYYKNSLKDTNDAYFVGGGTATNKAILESVVSWNRGSGKFIEITPLNSNANIKEFYDRLAEYIISAMKKKELENNSVQMDLLIGESNSLSLNELSSKAQSIALPILQDAGLNVSGINVKKLSSFSHSQLSMKAKHNFIVALKSDNYSSQIENQLKAASLINNAHFIGIGSNENKSTINNIIDTAMKKGQFIPSSGIEQDLTTLANSIVETVMKNIDLQELYIPVGSEVSYFTSYYDHENDSMLEDRWKFEHIPSYFENEIGLLEINNSYIKQPITQFNKTGRYQPFYSAKDDPLKVFAQKDIPLFENYRKWSDEADNVHIYVHRNPSSEFKFTLDSLTGAFTVTSLANDKDKESVNIGYGAGIQSQTFHWRYKNDVDWIAGLPTENLRADKVYEIRSSAKDFQGKTSYTTKILSRENLPPVAVFETDRFEYGSGQDVKITNYSHDPNGDNMTATWYIKKTSAADSTYKSLMTGSYSNGKGNTDWNPTIKNLDCDNKSSNEPCSYTIKLVVTDQYGESDETTQTITVVPTTEVIEIGIKDVEIFTAPAEKGLPVYIQLNEDILIQNPNLVENAHDAFVSITVNKDGKRYMADKFKVSDLLDGVQFLILPTQLETDKAYDFEFVLSSPDDSIIIHQDAEKIKLKDARTAAEKTITTNDIDYTYKGLVSVKRSINTDQVNMYEVIHLETAELKPTVTGLGHSLDQTFKYELPLNQHYSAEDVMNISSKVSFDDVLIDSHFDAANVVEGKAIVNTVNTDTVVVTGAKKETITQTLSYPKVYVESGVGDLYSENQKLQNDSRIQHELIDGGHKLYIPIWLDEIGKYDVDYKTTEVGVNKVSFEVTQKLDIEAYLFLHLNSSTKDKDKFLIEPVNKKLPFPNEKPADWSDSDVEWIKN